MDNRSNSRANTCPEGLTSERLDLLDQEPTMGSPMTELNHSNFANRSETKSLCRLYLSLECRRKYTASIQFRGLFRQMTHQYPMQCNILMSSNRVRREGLSRRWFIQISALSALDGSVLDYHGFNG